MKITIKYETPATAEQLSLLEKELAILLPEKCKLTLRKLFGATLSDNLHRKHEQVSVQKFCTLSEDVDSVVHIYQTYQDRIPANMLPIAHAEGGNLLLLSLVAGEVFFWDHELEEQTDESDGSEACLKLAASIDQLLEDLIPSKENTLNAKVVSVKIDPAFAAKFGLKLPTN